MIIREYKSTDKQALVLLLDEMLENTISIDELKLHRHRKDYGEEEAKNIISGVEKGVEMIYVAEVEGRVVGLIAGIVKDWVKADLPWLVPHKEGEIEDLFVSDEYRRQGVGTKLVEKITEWFKNEGCSVISVGTEAANERACLFYQKCGLSERDVKLMKKL
jgi:ribosomal protein S18 acetylase RimI-like enzyme